MISRETIICDQFVQHVKSLNVADKAPSKFTIEVALDDLDNLYWNDDMQQDGARNGRA